MLQFDVEQVTVLVCVPVVPHAPVQLLQAPVTQLPTQGAIEHACIVAGFVAASQLDPEQVTDLVCVPVVPHAPAQLLQAPETHEPSVQVSVLVGFTPEQFEFGTVFPPGVATQLYVIVF